MTTIDYLDVQRYMGTRYEIAKYPKLVPKKCVAETKAEYRLQAASGVGSYDHERDGQYATSKNGKVTWFHTFLEARLVVPQGFSVSVATVWIENPEDGEYDKQDCERKAFIRMADKLKTLYPRLPILILADGLYPYEGFFATCKANQWAYCVTFKDGNLPSVWQKANQLALLQLSNSRSEKHLLPSGKVLSKNFNG